MIRPMLIAATLCVTWTAALAQTSPDEIRRLLGSPVDILPSAGFAATVASYRDNCGGPPEFDGHAEMITRLEFGSLDAADRETYKAAMTRQYVSNRSILESLGGGAKKDFCRGLNSAVIRYAADFVEAHPSLFESKDPPPQPEHKSFQQEAALRLAGLSPLETLYVIRLAENKVIADAKGLITNPENDNADGQLWAMKVLAGDFALLSKIAEPHFEKIGKAYWDRAQIYARYIRGESDHAAMAREEQANEDRKNDLYQARFDAYIPSAKDPSKARTAMLKDVGDQLGSMVIGHAKMMTTEE